VVSESSNSSDGNDFCFYFKKISVAGFKTNCLKDNGTNFKPRFYHTSGPHLENQIQCAENAVGFGIRDPDTGVITGSWNAPDGFHGNFITRHIAQDFIPGTHNPIGFYFLSHDETTKMRFIFNDPTDLLMRSDLIVATMKSLSAIGDFRRQADDYTLALSQDQLFHLSSNYRYPSQPNPITFTNTNGDEIYFFNASLNFGNSLQLPQKLISLHPNNQKLRYIKRHLLFIGWLSQPETPSLTQANADQNDQEFLLIGT
jgi:hypothetical protein